MHGVITKTNLIGFAAAGLIFILMIRRAEHA